MNIFELTAEYKEIINSYDPETGEITEEAIQKLNDSGLAIEEKSVNTAKVIQMYTDNEESVDKEIERLKNIKKSIGRNKQRLKDNIKYCMDETGIQKIETDLYKISFRKSESVEVYDEALIAPEYIKETTKTAPDKTAIKKALKEGLDIQGAKLIQSNNLQIK